MVYFLGRDVSVALSTEATEGTQQIGVYNNSCTTELNQGTLDIVFAGDMNGKTTFAAMGVAGDGLVEGLTGLDISIGANDEDITFVGQKQVGKTEIKKDVTVTLTRKKNNNLWSTIFNGPCSGAALANFDDGTAFFGARWGNDDSGATCLLGDGLSNPKAVNVTGTTNSGYGYRVHIQLKSGTDDTATQCIAVPNCTISGYTVTTSPDGVDEETLEFSTNQSIQPAVNGDGLYRTLTPLSLF